MRHYLAFIFFLFLSVQTTNAQVSRRVSRSAGTVYGKLFYQAKGSYPASNIRLVLMLNTKYNLSLAQDSNQPFDEKTVASIGARMGLPTASDGSYQFSNVAPGNYILRVVGTGGNFLLFTMPANTVTYKLPDMPADYSKRRLPAQIYKRRY